MNALKNPDNIVQLKLDRSDFSCIGICKCGRTLSMTNIHKTEDKPLLAQAIMVCGNCQREYRFIVVEQE